MRVAVILAAAAAALAGAAAQDEWADRLEQLRPAEPMAYFRLAEEVADAAAGDAELDLARRLFGLAGALAPERLGRSACLALADLEANEHVKRRLMAQASLLDRRGAAVRADVGRDPAFDREASLAVAEAIAYFRRGNGARSLAILRDADGAMEILQRYAEAFRTKRFLADCELYSSKKPLITDQQRLRLLRLEAAILAGANRAWSGDLLLNDDRPLIEVDPDRIEEVLGVDASRPVYRDGRWKKARYPTRSAS